MPTENDSGELLWGLLDQSSGDSEKLARLLYEIDRDSLVQFHKQFRQTLYRLWKASVNSFRPSPEKGISDDAMEDILAYAVSQGKSYYEEMLAHPDRLPVDTQPSDVPFLGLAGKVFWERFQDEINLQ